MPDTTAHTFGGHTAAEVARLNPRHAIEGWLAGAEANAAFHEEDADKDVVLLREALAILDTAIDHGALQSQLRGPSGDHSPTFDAHWTGDHAGTVVYFSDGSRVNLTADGTLQFITHRDGVDVVEVLQKPVYSTEEAFRLIRSFGKQYEVKLQAERLLKVLEEDVPSSVAHYAVEGAKLPLRILINKIHTVDFFYGA